MATKTTYTIKTSAGFAIIRATDARTAVLKFLGKSPKSACYDVMSSSDGFVTSAAYTATVTKTSKYGTVIIGTVAVYEGSGWAV